MMVVGVARLTLLIPESHSLKEKRGVTRRLVQRLRNTFNCAVAEIGGQDTWQRAVLGIALVGHDRDQVRRLIDRVIGFVVDSGLADLGGDEREILQYGEGHMQGDLDELQEDDSWIPEAWKRDGEG
jgi:uncharacterized protein